MSDTQIWGVTPAPGARPKGVRAYLSRWGSAQPQPTLVSRISQELILRDFGRAPGVIVAERLESRVERATGDRRRLAWRSATAARGSRSAPVWRRRRRRRRASAMHPATRSRWGRYARAFTGGPPVRRFGRVYDPHGPARAGSHVGPPTAGALSLVLAAGALSGGFFFSLSSLPGGWAAATAARACTPGGPPRAWGTDV